MRLYNAAFHGCNRFIAAVPAVRVHFAQASGIDFVLQLYFFVHAGHKAFLHKRQRRRRRLHRHLHRFRNAACAGAHFTGSDRDGLNLRFRSGCSFVHKREHLCIDAFELHCDRFADIFPVFIQNLRGQARLFSRAKFIIVSIFLLFKRQDDFRRSAFFSCALRTLLFRHIFHARFGRRHFRGRCRFCRPLRLHGRCRLHRLFYLRRSRALLRLCGCCGLRGLLRLLRHCIFRRPLCFRRRCRLRGLLRLRRSCVLCVAFINRQRQDRYVVLLPARIHICMRRAYTRHTGFKGSNRAVAHRLCRLCRSESRFHAILRRKRDFHARIHPANRIHNAF